VFLANIEANVSNSVNKLKYYSEMCLKHQINLIKFG